MNNPFGLSDEVFNAILVSAVESAVKQESRGMKRQNPNIAQQQNTTLEKDAEAAKKLYDYYVAVGFNEIQAFELLKLVLSK